MTQLLPIVLAVLAALAFAVASTAQQRVAARIDSRSESGGSFIRRLVADPLWLVATVVDAIAVALQATALRLGQLSLIQPVLTVGLVFALALSARLDGRRLRPAEWAGAVAIGLGISLFVISTHPRGGSSDATTARWVITLSLAAVAVGALTAGLRAPRLRDHRASILALAAGIVFGIVAALTKSVFALLSIGVGRLATSWQTYGLFALALFGLALSQRAFQAAPLSASLPTLTIADPIVGAAVGVGLFGEQLAFGGWNGVVAAAAIASMFGGIVVLTRSPVHHQG